jgi:hypothetical protein
MKLSLKKVLKSQLLQLVAVLFTVGACSDAPSQSDLSSVPNSGVEERQTPSDVTVARYDAVRENLIVYPRSFSARERLLVNDSVRLDFGKHSILCQKNNSSSDLAYVCSDVPRGNELISVYVGQALFKANISLGSDQSSIEL